jgi:acyl-homoserine-lactone acylase
VAGAARAQSADTVRERAEAAKVTITRDTWGIAHVHAPTDALAVFGGVYAQAEDDFPRVEANYLTALGRTAEAEGNGAIWADGLNYYLATHAQVRPKVIRRFEPWMALSFSEGSIGGDIERASLPELAKFYGGSALAEATAGPTEPGGSNGIAIPRPTPATATPRCSSTPTPRSISAPSCR